MERKKDASFWLFSKEGCKRKDETKQLNPAPKMVKVQSSKTSPFWRKIPSSMGHVESRVNLRGPPRKAKYSWVTDSEEVQRWKGEREPPEGSEKEHETVSWQAVGGWQNIWPRACWRMSRRLIGSGKVKGEKIPEPKRKRVWKGRLTVTSYGPEPGWSNHGQIEVGVTPTEGSNRPMLKNRRMSCD